MYGPVSSMSGTVDNIFLFFVVVSAVLTLLVMGLMIGFAIKYHRKRHPKAVQIEGSLPLEILWTVVPIVLVLIMFYVGAEGFRQLRDVPEDAMIVQVTGRMWDWSFRYENGKEAKKLFVPVDQAVKLVMTSVDVNHSFYVPAFRIKEDLIPGQETYLWFKPQTTGPADIFCAEYCGQRHAYMMSEVVVLEYADWLAWYEGSDASSGEPRGVAGLLAEEGCLDCHSLSGREDVGPTFLGLYGSTRTVMWGNTEREMVADETYLQRAILDPDAEYVKGYETNMPVPELTDEEVQAIIDFIKELEK